MRAIQRCEHFMALQNSQGTFPQYNSETQHLENPVITSGSVQSSKKPTNIVSQTRKRSFWRRETILKQNNLLSTVTFCIAVSSLVQLLYVFCLCFYCNSVLCHYTPHQHLSLSSQSFCGFHHLDHNISITYRDNLCIYCKTDEG